MAGIDGERNRLDSKSPEGCSKVTLRRKLELGQNTERKGYSRSESNTSSSI